MPRRRYTKGAASLVVVCPFDTAEPFDQPLELGIGEARATFPHVDRDHPPAVGGVPAVVDTLHTVTRCAGTADQCVRVLVAQVRCDFRRYIRARKRLCLRTESLGEPVEERSRSATGMGMSI